MPLVYVYGFCPVPAADLALPAGIAHSTLLVQGEALAAIAEVGLDITPLKDHDQQLMTAVLSHDRVLQEVFAQTTVLPLRFGTQFADLAALRLYLHRHQTPHLTTLATLQDQAEYCLHCIPKPLDLPPLAANLKGRDYFTAKKQRLQAQSDRQQAQQHQMDTLVETWQHQGRPLHVTPADGTVKLYVLAERPSPTHPDPWPQVQAQLPDWEVQISDPLPPYHFVG